MSGAWNDFNDADEQTSYDILPKGTVAPVRMTIKPGGYDDPSQGWTAGQISSFVGFVVGLIAVRHFRG